MRARVVYGQYMARQWLCGDGREAREARERTTHSHCPSLLLYILEIHNMYYVIDVQNMLRKSDFKK